MTGETGRRRLLLGSALALCLIALFLAIGIRRHATAPAAAYDGTPLDPPKPAADFVLTDGRGEPAHVLDARVPLEFVFFGYTNCPDECPLALAALGHAYRALSPADRARVRVVFVTVDPARDTPAVIGKYVAAFDPHFVGLTGTRAHLEPVWQSYGVSVDPSTHEIGHGDAIYAIDGKGDVVLLYTPHTPPRELIHDVGLYFADGPGRS